jgi:hypothetical protein
MWDQEENGMVLSPCVEVPESCRSRRPTQGGRQREESEKATGGGWLDAPGSRLIGLEVVKGARC